MPVLTPAVRTRRALIVVLVGAILGAALATLPPAPAPAAGGEWRWPLSGRETGAVFDPPTDRYGAGHRGIDLPGTMGETVRAVAPGRVRFAGRVAGIGVVTVDHGTERSTYQPVAAAVRRGDAVTAGQPLGRLLREGSHCASACLHLGRRRGEDYLDPAALLATAGRFLLVSPDGPPPQPPATLGGGGGLASPLTGPITSPFGMRTHPVTGERKLHDGTDFAAACGTPVRPVADGTVIVADTHPAYGARVVLRHRSGFDSSYNHLSSIGVAAGQRTDRSTIVGTVGSTGLSTGCHLHLMIVVDGRPVDPMSRLPGGHARG